MLMNYDQKLFLAASWSLIGIVPQKRKRNIWLQKRHFLVSLFFKISETETYMFRGVSPLVQSIAVSQAWIFKLNTQGFKRLESLNVKNSYVLIRMTWSTVKELHWCLLDFIRTRSKKPSKFRNRLIKKTQIWI